MNRRQFFQTTLATAAAASALPTSLFAAPETAAARPLPMPKPDKLPRWRGFNLLEKFTYRGNPKSPFREADFAQMAEWGFNFVRLPMSYLCWTDASNWRRLKEEPLKEIDQAVDWGRQYGIHVNLNFHRAPGYCVNPPNEPKDLWADDDALETCAHHWNEFAKRYRGIPNDRVSFDLLNEPADIKEEVYARVVKRLVGAIREADPPRLIIADGLRWGRDPVPSLAELRVGQSTRGYDPFKLTHYKASSASGSDKWPEPTWPMEDDKDAGTLERFRRNRIQPWKELAAKGVGVHVGEWGVYQHTPHPVTLAWMKDVLGLWKEAGWGWSLWNFRGSFGIMDSGRKDVAYEDFKDHKLDRKMLELLRSF